MSDEPDRKPLTLRNALISLLALAAAVVGGFLFYLAFHSIPLAIFTGGATFAGAWRFYNGFIAE
jgi:hypothetical protein